MSTSFTVKENDFKKPPADSYYVDLCFIALKKSQKPGLDDYLNWTWLIADVPGQEEFFKMGARIFSSTPMVPTLKNRFGKFLEVLNGSLEKGMTGTIEDLILKRYRVKAFVKVIETPDKDSVLRIEDLIKGTAKEGVGIGVEGCTGDLRELANAMLEEMKLPRMKNIEKADKRSEPQRTEQHSSPLTPREPVRRPEFSRPQKPATNNEAPKEGAKKFENFQ